jgi:hypothetical protein
MGDPKATKGAKGAKGCGGAGTLPVKKGNVATLLKGATFFFPGRAPFDRTEFSMGDSENIIGKGASL